MTRQPGKRPRSHVLRFAALAALACFSAAPSAWARPRAQEPPELPLDATYETSAEPLSTSKIWSLDPEELNPHHQRWVLSRRVDLKSVEPVPVQGGGYAVEAAKLMARTASYFRPPGPWYRSLQEFPCSTEPEGWFATQDGARKAADAAAAEWEQVLARGKTKLSVLLSQVHGESAELAVKKAELLFRNWLRDMESEWRGPGRSRARLAEWRYYVGEAAAGGLCKEAGTGKRPSAGRLGSAAGGRYGAAGGGRFEDEYVPTWESMMEPPVAEGSSAEFRNLLARAPARRWDGLFSIRVTVQVGARKLVGQFLIDSAAAMSVISPSFLEGQGLLPAWVEVPGAPLQRVSWSGGSGLARRASVDRVEIGGYGLPIQDLLLYDATFFDVPDNVSPCCDGILGNDFLRHFAVELKPGPPAEVVLYPREGFHLPQGTPWIEVALTTLGEPVSACEARPEHPAGRGLKLPGVRWDTGSEMALDIHAPWQREARKQGAHWSLSCGERVVARQVPASFPAREAGEGSPFAARVPAVNAGIPLLARGDVFLDFANGRIWFTDASLKSGFSENRSGLELRYEFGRGGDRVLRVESVRKGTPAETLLKAGLKPGMLVTQIDEKPIEDLDGWEVNRRLSGVLGDTVSIRWKTRKGLRLEQLRVRQ